jgi:hypothetical protein
LLGVAGAFGCPACRSVTETHHRAGLAGAVPFYEGKTERDNRFKALIIPGTVDIIDPAEPSVTDLKTRPDAAALAYTQAHGADEQQRCEQSVAAGLAHFLGSNAADQAPISALTRRFTDGCPEKVSGGVRSLALIGIRPPFGA